MSSKDSGPSRNSGRAARRKRNNERTMLRSKGRKEDNKRKNAELDETAKINRFRARNAVRSGDPIEPVLAATPSAHERSKLRRIDARRGMLPKNPPQPVA